MSKYRTAAALGILPEERKALIAFVKSPSFGRVVMVNVKGHYYDQTSFQSPEGAVENECGTAGCVAGYVFAHARHVQKLRSLRGARDVDQYADAAADYTYDNNFDLICNSELLADLYTEAGHQTVKRAKKVVDRALRTGQVEW